MISSTMPTNIAKEDTTSSSSLSSSSCTTSSSKTTNTTQKLRFVSPVYVQEMINRNPSAVQIVDCRSFLNYNTERIIGSVNVYCPPLVKRRFQSCLPLTTMLSAETKVTLCRPSVEAVVLHDQSTDEALYHLGQSDLPLVLNSLRQLLGDRDYMVLSAAYLSKAANRTDQYVFGRHRMSTALGKIPTPDIITAVLREILVTGRIGGEPSLSEHIHSVLMYIGDWKIHW